MTEKRFTYDSKTVSILKDGEFWLDGNVDTACNHKEICELLNELNDENKELQKENEQLKQFQDSVFSWIDMHLQRLPKLRDDEFESDNEFADPSLYSGAIQILETMKIELKGDVE